MQREIQLTADGSHTVSIPGMEVTYHSRHGAIQESRHVFINTGLLPIINPPVAVPIHILEIGFGTGLNALLSWQMAAHLKVTIEYTSLEPYPLQPEEIAAINHGSLLQMDAEFQQMHTCTWGQRVQLDNHFTLNKVNRSVIDFTTTELFHCIYFDAFAPAAQPEMWTEPVFKRLFSWLHPGGSLLTYCSKSVVRHAMTAAGFLVHKMPGPHGKREMVKAIKTP